MPYEFGNDVPGEMLDTIEANPLDYTAHCNRRWHKANLARQRYGGLYR